MPSAVNVPRNIAFFAVAEIFENPPTPLTEPLSRLVFIFPSLSASESPNTPRSRPPPSKKLK